MVSTKVNGPRVWHGHGCGLLLLVVDHQTAQVPIHLDADEGIRAVEITVLNASPRCRDENSAVVDLLMRSDVVTWNHRVRARECAAGWDHKAAFESKVASRHEHLTTTSFAAGCQRVGEGFGIVSCIDPSPKVAHIKGPRLNGADPRADVRVDAGSPESAITLVCV